MASALSWRSWLPDSAEMTRRLFQLSVVFSSLLNVLFGSGWADEAFSAFAHRKGGWRRDLINGLFWWQEDHCQAAFYSELQRRQLPAEYRT